MLRDKPVADVIIQQGISHLLLLPTCPLSYQSAVAGKGELGKPFTLLTITSS